MYNARLLAGVLHFGAAVGELTKIKVLPAGTN
jgi:hypothetical protein